MIEATGRLDCLGGGVMGKRAVGEFKRIFLNQVHHLFRTMGCYASSLVDPSMLRSLDPSTPLSLDPAVGDISHLRVVFAVPHK